ncbi:uncharacterized protein LOC123301414 [Chrysoperla carnea]|uniref:uncharacterized protein LOC123301414 n=1 Tax=Chrysoperla carnea TaxID=189513 RepID=UPI001D07305B|nr:uncharacterized protein LOC123301414 [Chrysoperla carnea]
MINVNTSLCCEFVKSIDNENVSALKCFNTMNVIIDRQTDLKKWFLTNVEGPHLAELEEFQERDSRWALREVVHFRIHINKCQLLRGSSYIELPKCIKTKHACVNVKNNDEACFAWAVTSALRPVKDHDDHFDYDSIKHDNDDITIKYHFCWIKNFRLISREMSKHDGAIYICDRCQQYFVSEIKLIKHSEEFEQYNKCKVVLPNPDKKIMKFKNFANKERTVISVYVDFELYENCFDGDNDKFKLLTRKGVFPYDYISDLTKLDEQSLPSIDMFFKTLTDSKISIDGERVVKLRTRWLGRYGVKVLIAKPNFYNRTIFSENLVAIELKNLTLYYDRPMIVGMVTLDIARTKINDFHHGYVKPKFGNKAKGLYTDTDSIIYIVETDDIYDIIKADIHKFDTSDYEPNNIYTVYMILYYR